MTRPRGPEVMTPMGVALPTNKQGKIAYFREGPVKYAYRRLRGQRAHRLIVEARTGIKLPPTAVVHHVDPADKRSNVGLFVVCEDAVYHNIIERRGRALRECGNANWRKCFVCKYWDEPEHLIVWVDKRRPGNGYAKHRREGKCIRGPSAVLGKTQKRAKRMSAYGDRELRFPQSQALPPGYRVVWLEATEHYHWIDGDRRSEPIAGHKFVVWRAAWADYRRSHA